MADDVEPTTDSHNEPDESQEERVRARAKGTDRMLQLLISIVNSAPGASVNITLLMGGQVLSGWLIGEGDYLRAFATQMSKSFGNEQSSVEFFTAEADHRDRAAAANELDERRYIHLKDAKFVSHDGQLPHDEGLLWRGKLASVDGFTLGILSVTSAT